MRQALATGVLLGAVAASAQGYPVDGFEETGIRRLDHARLVAEGSRRDYLLPAGGKLGLEQVRPQADLPARLPPPDAALGRELRRLLGEHADRYGVALLDLTDPERPVYGAHNADLRANVGSVGKMLVAGALFAELARSHPRDLERRRAVLRETRVTADEYIATDHHKVRIWNPDRGRLLRRPLRVGDEASLWEFLDWMMSASSNAAASMVMQQLILLRRFGADYPASEDRMKEFLAESSAAEKGELLLAAMEDFLTGNGLDPQRLRQGSLFTGAGKRRVRGTTSYGTPRQLALLMLRLEAGALVDRFSSREIKRLLYMTERRIRYASHPALHAAAVYFKSGSLYSCRPEPGFVCRKYRGNRVNRLASVALVEAPAGEPKLRYIAVVMSNVLRVNSAVAHQTLAMRIHRLLERRHARSAAGQARAVAADQIVQADDELLQPGSAPGRLRQGHGDVAELPMLHQGAVRMPALPAPRLAVQAGLGGGAGQPLDELMGDGRFAEDGLHAGAGPRRDQPAGSHQVVEARHLQGAGAVGDVVQRIASPGRGLAKNLAHPESAVVRRVVEPVAGRLQDLGDISRPHPLHHGRGVAVGRVADHPRQGAFHLGIQGQIAVFDLLEGPQQDGDLGQTRRVQHALAVDGGEPRPVQFGDIHQSHRQTAVAHRCVQMQRRQSLLQARL